MGLFDDARAWVDDTWEDLTDPISDAGKAAGLSELTDPLKNFGRDFVSSDVGMFLGRVWATHGAAWFRTPQAFGLLGPMAPALGVLAMASPSLVRGETSFSRAYAQQALWTINTGAKVLQLKGVELPAAEVGRMAQVDAELIRAGAEKLREMKAYGVDLEALSKAELARIVGTDRLDLALLARAAITETLADVNASAGETAAIAAQAAMAIDDSAGTERHIARARRVAAGQALIDRAERVAAGQALIDRANGQQWDTMTPTTTSSEPRNRTAENLMLAGVIAAAIGALVWWQKGQRRSNG